MALVQRDRHGGYTAKRREHGPALDRRTARWSVVWTEVGADGKRRQRWKSGFKSRAEASTWEARERAAKADGTHIAPSAITVKDYLERWLGQVEARAHRGEVRPTTVDYYREKAAYVTARIGHVRLQDVTSPVLKRLYDDLARRGRVKGTGGLAPSTVRHVHATLSSVLAEAVEDGLLARNPRGFEEGRTESTAAGDEVVGAQASAHVPGVGT